MSIFYIAYLMLPIVALIALGYILRELKIFTEQTSEVLLKFLLYVTLPGVIISHLSGKNPQSLIHPNFIWATIAGLIIMYAVTFFLHKIIFKKDLETTSIAALCTSFVSTGIVGLPILQNILGIEATIIPVITNTILSLLIVVPITIFLARESEAKSRDSVFKVLKLSLLDTLKHPLVLSSILGLVILFFSIPIPSWLLQTLNSMGAGTFVVALVAVGAGINFKTLQKDLKEILFLTALRMGAFTLLGFGLAFYFQLPSVLAMTFVMIFALPTAKAVPGIAEHYKRLASESFQVVTLTTLLTIIIMPIVVYIANMWWPGVIIR